MANIPPGGPLPPVAPGIATPGIYPEWGVGGGTPGSSAGWKIVEAKNAAQQLTYERQGYLTWFASQSAAKAYVSSQSSAYGSGQPQNAIPGLAQIGDFFAALGQASTWVRVGEVVLGLILVAVGVARITKAVPIATKVAKTAGAVALA